MRLHAEIMRFTTTKVRRKLQQVLVRNTRSAEMIKTMHGSLAKPCILLIVSVDLVFLTKTCCNFLGLKSDKTV
jgi:hypothetical protein